MKALANKRPALEQLVVKHHHMGELLLRFSILMTEREDGRCST